MPKHQGHHYGQHKEEVWIQARVRRHHRMIRVTRTSLYLALGC